MCAVVKGYALVVQNSDNPNRRWDIPFDNPMFHWFTEEDCTNQLVKYFKETFQIPEKATLAALEQARNAQASFSAALQQRGAEVLAHARNEGTYAVVLAGARPYHNDDLVNHELPTLFTEHGIPVITADSLRRRHASTAPEQPNRHCEQLPRTHAFNGNPGSTKPEHGICADSKLRLRPRCVSLRRDYPSDERDQRQNTTGAEGGRKRHSRTLRYPRSLVYRNGQRASRKRKSSNT